MCTTTIYARTRISMNPKTTARREHSITNGFRELKLSGLAQALKTLQEKTSTYGGLALIERHDDFHLRHIINLIDVIETLCACLNRPDAHCLCEPSLTDQEAYAVRQSFIVQIVK